VPQAVVQQTLDEHSELKLTRGRKVLELRPKVSTAKNCNLLVGAITADMQRQQLAYREGLASIGHLHAGNSRHLLQALPRPEKLLP